MSWQSLIEPKSSVWAGVVQYADERIETLTKVCINAQSTDGEIRQAQAGIEEMQRLKAVPDSMKATAQMSDRGKRTGY